MNDLDQELLYDRENIRSTDFRMDSNEKLVDKSFKGLDHSLLGFGGDGIIESEIGEENQPNDELYSSYGR